MNVIYNICTNTLWLNLKIFSNFNIVNSHLVPRRGHLMVISNHLSNIDPGLLGIAVKRKLYFPAKSELFTNPFLGLFLKSYGAFPVKRNEIDITAFKKMRTYLNKNNGAIAMFPEGTRSKGSLIKAKLGAAKIVYMDNPKILPIAITGTSHMKGLFRVFSPSGYITVTIGEPFKINLPAKTDSTEKEILEQLTEEMMLRIANLLPKENRGVYTKTTKEKFSLTENIN